MPTDNVTKDRWLSGQEKEKEYNKDTAEIRRRLTERKIIWDRLLKILGNDVTFDSSKKILDVGAEVTSIFLALKEGQKCAVDPLFEYLFHQHPFLKDVKEYQNVRFVSSPFEEMPAEEKFDVIFMLACLDHFGNIKPVLNKVDELLTPGGKLVILADCFKDEAVKKLMSSFDLYQYHPHHFVETDVAQLFSGYTLNRQKNISDIYDNCPAKAKREKIKIYRVDKLISRVWRISEDWGKKGNPLLILKIILFYGLALPTAFIRHKEQPVFPFTKTQLFVFQKP